MVALGPALLLLAVTAMFPLALTSPRVSVAQGELRGSWMRTRGGRRVAAFRGIPYAAPPTRQLRFKSPQPPEPWQGRRSARDDGPPCYQFNPILGIHGEEDCLYLNVYSPNDLKRSRQNRRKKNHLKLSRRNRRKQNHLKWSRRNRRKKNRTEAALTSKISSTEVGMKKLPVLFFIHGGAFKSGSGGSLMYGPKYLLDEDIVLVTVNYRLGVFGFLSTDDNIIPGNFGLKDQRAALRWVQDNIEQFGGDPRVVTIFGESAGATSAHYHMMFNSGEGLFRAGILHSGSALSAGSFQRPGDQKPLIRYLLNKTGCPEGDSVSILDCLQKVPAFRLTRFVHLFSPPYESLMRRVELSPVMEPGCVEDAFVTGDPWNKTTSLPMIIGTNQFEGMFIIEDILKDETNEKFKHFNSEYQKLIPFNLMFNSSAEDPQNIANQLREFYIEENETKRENFLKLVDMISDGIFNYGVASAVKKNTAETFLYSFKYLGSKSLMNLLGYENSYGPTHFDELFLFFPMPLFLTRKAQRQEDKTEEDMKMSANLIKMWTNFATHMTPVPEGSAVSWEPVSGDDLRYLNINGPGDMTMESGFYRERVAFWDNLPFRNKPMIDVKSCVA